MSDIIKCSSCVCKKSKTEFIKNDNELYKTCIKCRNKDKSQKRREWRKKHKLNNPALYVGHYVNCFLIFL